VIRIINPPQSVDKCFNALRVPRLDIAADTHIMKLHLMQNRVLRTTGNSPRPSPIPDLHMAFRLPYVYDFIAKLCRRPVEVILSHGNENIRIIWTRRRQAQEEWGLKFRDCQACDLSND